MSILQKLQIMKITKKYENQAGYPSWAICPDSLIEFDLVGELFVIPESFTLR